MRIRLFCKTFKDDLGWLGAALTSFFKNWDHADTEFVLVADRDCQKQIESWKLWKVKVFYVEPWPDGYCHAMAMKMYADYFCGYSVLVMLFDSDIELVKPVSMTDLLPGGKPVIQWSGWEDKLDPATRAVARRVWTPAVERCTGKVLDRERYGMATTSTNLNDRTRI
jgi:hypothetical protein